MSKSIYLVKSRLMNKNTKLIFSFTLILSLSLSSLFLNISSSVSTFVLVYVDDIIITGSDNQCVESLIFHLSSAFPLKDLGTLGYFLGLRVTPTSKEAHWQAVKRILRYLSGTLDYGLHLTKSTHLNLTAFCDADWGSDPDDRKSTSGFCVYLGANVVSWASKKQHIVSRSSTEAEYRSLAHTTAEVTWLSSLRGELQVPMTRLPEIWCDNQSTVLMAANPVLHSRTKHIELDYHFIREKVVQGIIQVKFISGND